MKGRRMILLFFYAQIPDIILSIGFFCARCFCRFFLVCIRGWYFVFNSCEFSLSMRISNNLFISLMGLCIIFSLFNSACAKFSTLSIRVLIEMSFLLIFPFFKNSFKWWIICPVLSACSSTLDIISINWPDTRSECIRSDFAVWRARRCSPVWIRRYRGSALGHFDTRQVFQRVSSSL